MTASTKKYLFDIACASADALEFVQGPSFADYVGRKLVDDAAVYRITTRDLPVLRQEVLGLLERPQ